MLALCYYDAMARKQSDLSQLKNNKMGTRFSDLERILKQNHWELQSITGSHHVYCKTGCMPIMLVKPHGNHKFCHPMDVNKVISVLDAPAGVEDEEEQK